MAELRMRIFSNREKQQTHEDLEEEVNEFLASVYQVERILQSGGDYFTTITVWYWDRPSQLSPGSELSLAELESELGGAASPPGGSAGTGETLSHVHELAAQGVRGLALEQGGTEHPGLDTTRDDLRRSNLEAHYPYRLEDPMPAGGPGELRAETIAESLAEELSETPHSGYVAGDPREPGEVAWEHSCELHRLEDGMLTALEKLNAFRATHPLSGPELMDFLLSEELLVQLVEQARAASEELGSTLREYALGHGLTPSQSVGPRDSAQAGTGARIERPGEAPDLERLEAKLWQVEKQSHIDAQIQKLQRELEAARQRKNELVSELRESIAAEDGERQQAASRALEQQQRRLAELRRGLRDAKSRLDRSDPNRPSAS
jgi:hypothetical protein